MFNSHSQIPNSVQHLLALIVFLICLVAVIIRRRWKLQRYRLIQVFVDFIVVFIGGGNVAMQHKIEKCFLIISFVSTFFVTSLFVSDLVGYVIQVLCQKIPTFEQLSQMNTYLRIHKSLSES